jgi:hypothetical protein
VGKTNVAQQNVNDRESPNSWLTKKNGESDKNACKKPINFWRVQKQCMLSGCVSKNETRLSSIPLHNDLLPYVQLVRR